MGARIEKNITPQLDADGLAEAQTLSGGGVQNVSLDGALIVDGSFIVTDSSHIIEITSLGNDSGITFTITGTDNRDIVSTEVVTGANIGIASTVKHFKTVSQVSASGDTAADVSIGVSGLCVSSWLTFMQGDLINIGLGIALSSGAVLTYAVQHTFDDIQQNADVTFNTLDHDDLNNKTVSDDGNYAFPATAYRFATTAYTSGTVIFTSWQSF